MDNPKIGVITPVYCTDNNDRYQMLLDTMKSVSNERKNVDLVYVVVDDGSCKKCAEAIDEIGDDLGAIVLHQNNQGQSAAINHGVRYAISNFDVDYVTYCHSDDVFVDGGLKQRLLAIQDYNALITNELLFYQKSYIVDELSVNEMKDDIFNSIITRKSVPYNLTWTPNVFENIGGFDEKMRSGEDWEIVIRTLKYPGINVALLDVPTIIRRFHNDNLRYENCRNGERAKTINTVYSQYLKGNKLLLTKVKANMKRLANCIGPHVMRKLYSDYKSVVKPNFNRVKFDENIMILDIAQRYSR